MGINIPAPMRAMVPMPPSGAPLRYNGMESSRNKLSDREKISKISSESPKMFYTPDEFPCPIETEMMQLMFRSSDFQTLMLRNSENQESSEFQSMTVYKKVYKKVHFRNSKHEFLLVDTDQLDLFNEIYLNKKKENLKKYI